MTVSSFLFGQAYVITVVASVLFNLLGLCVIAGSRHLGYLPHHSAKFSWSQWTVFAVFSLIPFINVLYLAERIIVVCVLIYHLAHIRYLHRELEALLQAQKKSYSKRNWSAE